MYSTNFTGIGRYVYELTRYLKDLDSKNDYVLFFNEPEFSEVDFADHPRFKKVLVDAKHYSWDEQTKFLKILNEAELDLMHFTHFNAPLFYKGASVVTIHDLTLSFYPGKKMTKPWHRLGYHFTLNNIVKKARRVIAVSKNTKKDLLKLMKVTPGKVAVIYEGVGEEFRVIQGEERLRQIREKWGLPPDFILYTGVWRNHKNLTTLIKAFHHVRRAQPEDPLKLVITGREDPAYPEVKQMVQELNLEGQVVFPGLVPNGDLVLLYNAARMYVLPSFYEGFGLSVLEAFACGTPVICSKAACLPEVVGTDAEGEPNALLFDPENYEECAEQILRLLRNESLQGKLVSRGMARVANFSFQRMAVETLEVYNACLGSG